MRPFSQRLPFARRDMLIQGDSVRQIWGTEEPAPVAERPPLRRDVKTHAIPVAEADDWLRLRLGEELDYASRMLDATGDDLSADPIAVARHGMALQSFDIVGQMLGQIANVIRSSDMKAAVQEIRLCDLKARLTRGRAL